MKAKQVIILLFLGCILVVGAAFLKVQHVGNAEYFLVFAMLFQVGIFGYIVWKSMKQNKGKQ